MNRFKLCPTCGHQNDPRNMECSECGTDLMGIPLTDTESLEKAKSEAEAEATASEQTESAASTSNPASPSQVSTMVKICSCGEVNPAAARKCQRCQEDLSDILPTPMPAQQESQPELHYQLRAIGDDYTFTIPCGTSVVGREQSMSEYLAAKSYVSRIHAKISVIDGKLYVENLSKTNYTFVNNIRIPNGRVQLNEDDELSFGGITMNGQRSNEAAYFKVIVAE